MDWDPADEPWFNLTSFNFSDWSENFTDGDENLTFLPFNETFHLTKIPISKSDIVGSVIYVVFSILALIANSVVIVLLYKRGRKRSVFDITVGSLVFADLLTAVGFLATTTMFYIIMNAAHVNESSLRLVFIFLEMSIFCFIVSLLHILLITIERLYALFCPLKYRQNTTKTKAKVPIVFIWMISLAATCIDAFLLNGQQAEHYLGIMTFASGGILCALYGLIAVKIIRLKKHNKFKWNKDHLVLMNSLAVTVSFLACLFPFAIGLLGIGDAKEHMYLLSSFTAVKLLLDPVLYFYVSFWKGRKAARRQFRMLTAATFINMTCTASNTNISFSQLESNTRNNNDSQSADGADFATLSKNADFRRFTKKMSVMCT